MIDYFLKLLMTSREYRLSDLVANYKCFERIFSLESKYVQQFLEESQIETTESEEVTSLLWNPKHKMISFGTNHSLLSKAEIETNVAIKQWKKANKVAAFVKRDKLESHIE